MNSEIKIAVVGLGYVGLPLAIAFSKKLNVIGFDTNEAKIQKYLNGEDPTCEVGNDAVLKSDITFTNDPNLLRNADYIIVAVPTPIHNDKTPDLSPVVGASKIIGKNMKKGAVVIFESTVYPGVTEDVCASILEEESNMKCGEDFYIGYSPERINPGDKVHRLENIKKIVSGMNDEICDKIAKLYELIIEAGVHKTGSIKVAEAAKLVENAQRDINIAFMNELAMVFDRMDISTKEVMDAMNTKWNALGFYPGLVGGHCIGVDPYYFIYQAKKLGYHSEIIAAGRKVNDDMPVFIAQSILQQMILSDVKVKGSNIYFMGVTFKENCPDIRNSKSIGIIQNLKKFNMNIKICDPWADSSEMESKIQETIVSLDDIKNADCIVFTVAHKEFKDITVEKLKNMFNFKEGQTPILIDIHNIFNRNEVEKSNITYWSL